MKKLLIILLLLCPIIGLSQPFSYPMFNPTYDTWLFDNSPFKIFSDANRVLLLNGTSGGAMTNSSTVSKSSGKPYCEVLIQGMTGGTTAGVGMVEAGFNASNVLGIDAFGYGYYSTARKRNNGSNIAYGSTFTTNDIIGIAIDLENGAIYFSVNNVFNGTPTSGASRTGAAFTWTPSLVTPKTIWIACSTTAVGTATFKILATPQSLNYAPPAGYSPGIKQ